jgi:hypothetical protein
MWPLQTGQHFGSFGRRRMDRHPNNLTTDEQIDASLERAQAFDLFPRIIEAEFHADEKLQFLMLRLNDGQQLLVPRQMLEELKHATPAQAADLFIGPQGLSVWWPQLDDGLYLPDFLEHRWGKVWNGLAA